MMVTGIVFSAVGVVFSVPAIGATASAAQCTSPCEGGGGGAAAFFWLLTIVHWGVGIPLLAVGASKPAQPAGAWYVPQITAGPHGARAGWTWRF
jgi:hypothetical protein